MKFTAVTLLTLAAGALAAPVAEAAPEAEAAPGYATYGDYKGAGEDLKSYPSYGSYGAKPKPKPKPAPAPKKYTDYGEKSLEQAAVHVHTLTLL